MFYWASRERAPSAQKSALFPLRCGLVLTSFFGTPLPAIDARPPSHAHPRDCSAGDSSSGFNFGRLARRSYNNHPTEGSAIRRRSTASAQRARAVVFLARALHLGITGQDTRPQARSFAGYYVLESRLRRNRTPSFARPAARCTRLWIYLPRAPRHCARPRTAGLFLVETRPLPLRHSRAPGRSPRARPLPMPCAMREACRRPWCLSLVLLWLPSDLLVDSLALHLGPRPGRYFSSLFFASLPGTTALHCFNLCRPSARVVRSRM